MTEPQQIPTPEENPLLFWVAYLPNEDGTKFNYLSDGKHNLRVFRSEAAIRQFLESNMPPAFYERVVVHSVQGQIAVPFDNFPMPVDQLPGGSLHVPNLDNIKRSNPFLVPPPGTEIIPLDMLKMKPIRTTAADTYPTSLEQLHEYERRNKKRRRRNK